MKRIGIVQRNTFHSEVFGPFMSLCKTLSWECVLYHSKADPLTMIPQFKEWLDMTGTEVRETDAIYADAPSLDKIILLTSDEWNQHKDFITEHREKLILVHHDTAYYKEGDVCLFLTPFFDLNKWVFPLYAMPSEDLTTTGDGVALIGAINNRYNKLRDVQDICRYLDSGRQLNVFARSPEDAPVKYRNLEGKWGLSSRDLIRELRSIKFFWFPVTRSSMYTERIFTGGLALAVNMRKIMIMPEFLAEAYGLSECVLAYKTSIMEIDLAAVDEEAMMSALDAWIERRSKDNLENFKRTLGPIE